MACELGSGRGRRPTPKTCGRAGLPVARRRAQGVVFRADGSPATSVRPIVTAVANPSARPRGAHGPRDAPASAELACAPAGGGAESSSARRTSVAASAGTAIRTVSVSAASLQVREGSMAFGFITYLLAIALLDGGMVGPTHVMRRVTPSGSALPNASSRWLTRRRTMRVRQTGTRRDYWPYHRR
jgi:hypothetical protein